MRLSALVAVVAALLPALPGGAATIHLKPGATGDGSGSSWSNACTTFGDAVAKLNYAEDGSELRIAQGVYVLQNGETLAARRFVLRGGYRASADDDTAWDPQAYQTIFTPDTDGNDRVRPVKVIDYTTSQPTVNDIYAVRDGKVNLPSAPYEGTGEFGGYILFTQSGKNAVSDFLTVGDKASGTIDGIAVCGMTGDGTVLSVADSAGDVTVGNCVFAYNTGAKRTEVVLGAAANGQVRRLANCTFFANEHNWNPIVSAAGGAEIVGCRFEATVSSAAKTGRCLEMTGTGNVVRNCTFRRVTTLFPGGFANSAGICRMLSGDVTFDGCTFDRCVAMSAVTSVTTCPAFFALQGGGTLTNCTFTGCRMCAYGVANGCYALTASSTTAGHTLNVRDCRFVGNSIRVVPQTTQSCNYLVGVVGNAANGQCSDVRNCVFDGTTFTCEPVEGIVPLVARAAFTFASGASSASMLAFVNNTVTGPRPDGAYDLVQYGAGHKKPLNVHNSIFASDAFIHRDNFYADCPTLWSVKSCTVKNMTFAYRPTDIDVSDGFSSDDIPLAADYTPAARTPGIRNTTDGSVRGAVNALTAAAENGFTLTVRCDPVSGVVLSSPATQAVQPGEETAPVTAEGLSGVTMLGWFEEDGTTPIVSGATLPAQTLTADRVVVAKLDMPKVRFTFDLGACGTFDETGQPTAEISVSAGEAFPGVPAHTIDTDSWVFQGWNPELPTVTPSEPLDFKARYVTKQLRTIRVVPSHATPPAVEDGLSWETAYTDLGTAYRDAATYQGEVWLAKGTYRLPASIPMLSRVKVLGGFVGTETSSDEADPAANPTVLTIQGAVFYAEAGSVENPSFDGLVFRDVKNSAIRVNGATVTGLSVTRCTFDRCNTAKASDYGVVGFNACSAVLKDCLFTNSYHCAYFYGTTAETVSLVDGCRFVGNDGANYGTCVYIAGKGPLTVTNSAFAFNTNVTQNCNGSASITCMSDSTGHRVSDCQFLSNVVAGSCKDNVALSRGEATVERCRFEGNVLLGCWNATTYHAAALSTGGQKTIARDCTFVGNTVATPSADSFRCVAYCGANKSCFVNCTFDGNALARAEGDTGILTTLQFFGHNQSVALVHCAFRGSVLPTGSAEIDCHGSDTTSYQNCALSFVNSAFWNDDAAYRPVEIAGKAIPLWVQQSVVRNLDTNQYARSFICEGLVTNRNPQLAAKLVRGSDGLLALPLSGRSDYRRYGCRVWDDPATGLVYAYDATAKKHRRLDSLNSAGLPAGVTEDSPLLADVWGQPRQAGRVAIGPANAQASGFSLFVR